MEDFVCPRCKTSKFQNPSMKMMVNVCGHGLCESCVDLLFLKGSGSCPECGIALRRNNFRVQLFEDASVEREVDIRKRVLRDYNKREEDFNTLREYNDYLEQVETIIYNLANNIDVMDTNKQIEQYRKENRDQIMKSKGKLSKEEYALNEIIELEKQQAELRKQDIIQEEIQTKKRKLKEKEALIDELMFSNANAKNIVETFVQHAKEAKEEEAKQPPKRVAQFSTGVRFGMQQSGNFIPVPEEGPLYSYKPFVLDTNGPQPPTEEEIVSKGYINNVRSETEQEKAGGFVSTIACTRAIQDALGGLYNIKKTQTT